MASLQDIKGRIRGIESTKKITSAMKLVATAKLNKSKENVLRARPFFNKMKSVMQSIAYQAREADSPFFRVNQSDNKLYIVLTSDRGLCGAYNVNICKTVMGHAKEKDKVQFIVVGRKGRDIFITKGYEIQKEVLDVSEEPSYDAAREIAHYVSDSFISGSIGEVYFAYTHFISSIKQEPVMFRLLPIDIEELKNKEADNAIKRSTVLAYEPSAEEVLSYVVPRYIADMVYGGLVEAGTSEHGARMTAMDAATDNAQEIMDELKVQYNRARQGAITQELSEIIGGAEALK